MGHGRTFWVGWKRCREVGGELVLRIEDLDKARCREEYSEAAVEDLEWLGMGWDAGPVYQGGRTDVYRVYLKKLEEGGYAYPCYCSRRDILASVSAPHETGDEPLYPGTCRDGVDEERKAGRNPCWRFRVPDGESISFTDGYFGRKTYVAGHEIGDFVLWRQDGIPSYQLAVVVDDYLGGITEVVRGEDLLKSTARQILLYRALGWQVPHYFHCPLVLDENGQRLAKRHESLALRQIRQSGVAAEQLLAQFEGEACHWWRKGLDFFH